MRLAGGRPSSVSTRVGGDLTVALWLRDALSLPCLPEIPPLDPAAGPDALAGALAGEAHDDVPVRAWVRWWDALLAAEPGTQVPPPDGGPLAAVVQHARAVAGDWGDPTLTGPAPQLAWLAPLLGAATGPTRVLHVDVVPVRGVWHQETAHGRMLLSGHAWLDDDAAKDALEPWARRLLQV